MSRARWTIVVAVAAGALGWFALASGDDGSWVEAEADDLVVTVAVEGQLASRDSSILTPPQVPNFYDFQISFMAPEGSQVGEGDPVLGFDTAGLEQQLLTQMTEAEQAAKNIEKLDGDLEQRFMELELQLAEARGELRKAELKNEIPDDLRAANEARIAALDVEAARNRVASLERQLEAARAAGRSQRGALVAQRTRAVNRVREIERSIEQMMVPAPRAGTVIYITNWRGDKKKVGDSAWRRERVIELPDLSRMLARGEVDESDAGRIAEGQTVNFRLDAHPDEVYSGTIESIWRTVQRKSGTRNPLKVVRLDIALDDTDVGRMRPGMRFRGQVEIERLAGVTTIPARSIATVEGGTVVYREGMIGLEAVPVQLGARSGGRVQVLEGLEPGDRIAEVPPRDEPRP